MVGTSDSRYWKWPDEDLLEEADTRSLSESAYMFLDDLMRAHHDYGQLTKKQRWRLVQILEESE